MDWQENWPTLPTSEAPGRFHPLAWPALALLAVGDPNRESLVMGTPRLWLVGLALVVAAGCSQEQRNTQKGSASLLEQHVRFLTASSPTRDWTHPAALAQVAQFLAEQLTEAGGRVELQEFSAEGQAYSNVRAFFGPTTARRLIVGAHFDVAGELPGADDNASGVAALLGVARRLGTAELTSTVELVAYCLEEPPFFRTEFMGSAVHARSLVDEGVELLGMINLEMVGYFSDEPDSQEFPVAEMKLIYPTVGNFITLVGRSQDAAFVSEVDGAMAAASELPTVQLISPVSAVGVDYSDHLNYWAEGFDAVMITDTSFYRNPHYHTASDTADTLDYGRMELVVEGVVAAVLHLAQGPAAPR